MDGAYMDPVVSFETWKLRQPKNTKPARKLLLMKNKNKETAQIEPRWTPKPLDETMSESEFFKMRPQAMNAKAKESCQQIKIELGEASKKIKEFQQLSKELDKRLQGPRHVRLEICVIGATGIGKSTFINAILNRPGLADASDSTRACTQHATTYEYLPGAPDNTRVSNINIVITDASTREQEAQDHIDNYSKVHVAAKDTSMEEDGEIIVNRILTEEDRTLAKHALDYFQMLWKAQSDFGAAEDLDSFLQDDEIHDGRLLQQCLQKQAERIQDLCAKAEENDHENILFTGIPDEVPESQTGILDLTAVRELAAAIWPLIHKVYVRTGGTLLRNGIALTDLPGYGDLNQGRIATANAFRRNADYEVIIGEGLRLEDSKSVNKQIRSSIHSHGLDRTILIINKLDTNKTLQNHFHTSDDEVLSLINESEDEPFKSILQRLSEVENMEDLDETSVDNYSEHLLAYAKSAAQRLKAQSLKTSVQETYGEQLQTFSVSSQSWIDWTNSKRIADPPFGPRMSGIPATQEYLLNLTAEHNIQRYHFHFFNLLPKVEDRVRRILTKSAQEGGYFKLRDTTQDDFEIFKSKSKSRNPIPIATLNACVPKILTNEERTSAEQRISSLVELWRRRWSVRWITWDYTLRSNGIPHHSISQAYAGRDVNWNRDLLEVLERPPLVQHEFSASVRHIEAWKNDVMEKSAMIVKSVGEALDDINQKVEGNIEDASISSDLRARFGKEWLEIKDGLLTMMDCLKDDLHSIIVRVYRRVTTEEDIGCTIAKITKGPFQEAAREPPRGAGAWGRQHQKMRSSMAQFVTTYEKEAMKLMKRELKQTVTEFLKKCGEQFDTFLETTEQFFETEVYDTAPHREARAKLEAWLPTFMSTIEEIQQMFPKSPGRNHTESSIKRVKIESSNSG
ncbi:hypothetical protein DM02DRAFT_710838 [Periconia macrospinosa]|uniref:Dynamin N-terminal domain-containing protein n=1 Tax=Periconia macrospinosa TaxID=97972 RepID=A0A2V1EAW4_9PLEO|nr:hypothetical protein DM02DRAFT_710838 [Periconia macrospinosa]